MKNLFYLFRRLAPVAVFLLYCTITVNAQVPTKFLTSDAELQQQLPWIFPDAPSARMAQVPASSAARFASYDNEAAPALGLPQPLVLTEADGDFYDFDTYTVWKLPIVATGAESISVILSDVTLPARSQLVVYSRESAMYHGPVTAKDLVSDSYFCDLIVGDNAVIEVVMPLAAKADFKLSIPGYLYGTEDKSHLLLNGNRKVVTSANE